MIYCISDIHGNYKAYKKLLEKINFSDKDTLYVLGDVIDRGSGSIKILQDMMMRPNVIPIIGNHEYMAINCLKFLMQEISRESISLLDENIIIGLLEWLNVGGQATIEEFHKLSLKEKQEIIDYIQEFSIYEELTVGDKDYILVHAGLGNYSPQKDIEDYSLEELIWDRTDYDVQYYDDVYVVTGHTPTQRILNNPNPGFIFRKNNHIAIDCGSCFSGGRLGAICLDTGEEFYA